MLFLRRLDLPAQSIEYESQCLSIEVDVYTLLSCRQTFGTNESLHFQSH